MMATAELFAQFSYCKKKKVGAVLASPDGRVLCTGYNGTFKGHSNDCEDVNGLTKDLVVHAEQNIVSYCACNGIAMKDTVMYITISPCQNCAKLIAQSGVIKVVYDKVYKDTVGIDFLKDIGVEVIKYEGKE